MFWPFKSNYYWGCGLASWTGCCKTWGHNSMVIHSLAIFCLSILSPSEFLVPTFLPDDRLVIFKNQAALLLLYHCPWNTHNLGKELNVMGQILKSCKWYQGIILFHHSERNLQKIWSIGCWNSVYAKSPAISQTICMALAAMWLWCLLAAPGSTFNQQHGMHKEQKLCDTHKRLPTPSVWPATLVTMLF